jgi:biotin carboxylase
VDGVIAYASDPAVLAGARTAEALGLAGNRPAAVIKLSYKHEFRRLQRELGVPCPPNAEFRDFTTLEQWSRDHGFPVMVKSVDASGSKGVVRVDEPSQLSAAFAEAMRFSRCRTGIVEGYIRSIHPQIHGDAFVDNGRVVFACLGDHRFAPITGRYTPVATTIPSAHPPEVIRRVVEDVDRILAGAGFARGPINIEARVDGEGQVCVIEIGARNGGNFMPQLIQYACGADMVDWCLKVALGEPLDHPGERLAVCHGYHSHYILHSTRPGRLGDVQFSRHLQGRILEQWLLKRAGAKVERFVGSHATLGVLLLRYPDRADMIQTLDHIDQHVEVRLDAKTMHERVHA